METIKSVRFEKLDKYDPVKVFVTVGGVESLIFDFFDDEISFTESELIGKTIKEAVNLRIEKDKQFLVS